MTPRTKNLLLLFAAALVVIGCGAVEDGYGRFDYGADAIAYLDLAKAIHAGDWTLAASPYWSLGYSCLLALVSGFFSPDATGEWTGIRVVNLLCFLGSYLSFLWFLATGMTYLARMNGAEESGPGKRFVYVIATCLFLGMQLINGAVSRVSPDLLVSAMFFLINALSIRFFLRPAVSIAVWFGLAMGFGFVVKAVLLPISAVTFLALLLHLYLRRPDDRFRAIVKLAWALPVMAFIMAPSVAGSSWALGHFSLGEAGKLNHAWNVNGLPHGIHWQGGPAPFGTPIHPTRLVGKNPPVFEFGEPFEVTYAPIFNQFYWYDGYQDFFNLHNQVRALNLGVTNLLKCFVNGPHLTIKILGELALFFSCLLFLTAPDRREWVKRALSIWPLYLSPLAALFLYASVVVEPRYVIGFLLATISLPFLPFFVPTELTGRRFGYALAIVFVIGTTALLGVRRGDIFLRATVNTAYTTDVRWMIGRYLVQAGFRPGDKIAAVTVGSACFCTWAHVCGAHIVAEIGNNVFDLENQEKDFRLFTDNPEVQQQVFLLFKQAGAVMVVVPQSPVPLQGTGWEHIPGTDAWVHRLD